MTFEDADGNPVALLAGQSVTVTLGTAAGLVLAATEGVDYVSVDGDTVTITGTADGVSSTTFTVETTDDYLADTGEQYIVEISDPTGTGLGSTVGIATGKGTVTTTIADQTGPDSPPGTEDTVYAVISVDDASIEEGEQAVFTVSLQDKDGNAVTATSDIDVTLEWTGAAANAGDAAPLPTTVTVTNGSTTATVIAVDDYFKETPEDLIATITGLVDQDDPDAFENLAIGDVAGNNTSATTTITDEADPDDDDTVYAVISVDDASIEEGEQAVFTVSLQDKDGNAVTAPNDIEVALVWSGVAATVDDVTPFPLPTSVTLTAGSGSVTVLATLDGVVEPDEPLTATIASITDPQDNYENYELGTPAGTGLSATTVIEDASALKVALTGAATVVEGESATYTVTFEDADGNPVALLAGQSVTVTLGTTAAGLVLAATEGVDYVSVDGDTVTITGTADGVSSTTFTVETTDDYLADTGEQYIVEISDPTGTGLGSTVGIATGKGTVTTTIADQTGPDSPPGTEDTVYAVISVDDASIEEGEQAVFTVSLQDKDGNAVTATSDIDVTLEWTGAAANAGDAAPLPTTVTVTNGSTTATVIAVDDYFKETPEDLIATITGLVDQDDPDAFENLAIGDVAGNNTSATTTITDEADPDDDDTVYAVISVDDASIEEGEQAVFTVSLQDKDGNAVTAPNDIEVALVWSGVAATVDDVTPFPLPTSVTLTAGSGSVTVLATLDGVVEPDEPLTATIASITDPQDNYENYELGTPAGTGLSATTVIEDASALKVALTGAATVVEGESATYTVTFEDADGNPVALLAGQSVTVTLGSTAAGLVLAATEGVDYVSVDGDTVTITGTADGVSSTTFTVETTDDYLADTGEQYIVEISDPTSTGLGSTVGIATGKGTVTTTIADQTGPDSPPGTEDTVYAVISVDDASIEEGEQAVFTVSLQDKDGNAVTATSDIDVTLEWTGAAATVDDVTPFPLPTSVTLTAGSGSVTVLATLDGVVEPDEPLTATIASITDPQDNYENYELGTPAGTGLSATTVIEDASALKVALTGAATVVEGESATYTVTFEDADGNPVALLAGQSVTVTLGTTAAGLVLAATEGVDYVSVDGDTVTITGTADGVSSTTFTVETTDDYLADTGEQYIVEISDPTSTGLGSTVGIATGKGTVTTTIADQTGTDDPPGTEDTVYAVISVDDASIEEGEQAVFTVSLQDKDGNAVTATSDIDVTLEWTGAAANAGDAAPLPTTVTVTNGSTTATVIAVDDYFKETPEDLIATITGLVDQDDPDAFENLAIGDVAGNNTSATTTITDEADPDDDDTVYAVISVDDASIEEGEQAVFTVSLQDKDGNAVTATSDIVVTLAWTGAAANAGDAAPLPTTVTVTNGSTTATVIAVDDYFKETPEDLIATITGLVDQDDPDAFENLAIGDVAGNNTSATTTITDEADPDDDDTVYAVISVDDASIEEGEQAVFTVSLQDKDGNAVTATSDIVVTLTWTGAAANAGDAAPLPTTVTVTNGSTTATVIAVDDYFKETPEDLIATITGLVDQDDPDAFENLAIGDVAGNNTSATTTITDEADPDDDDTVYAVISVDDASIEEGEQAVFTVSLQDKDGNAVTAPNDIEVALVWSGVAATVDDVTPFPLPTSVTLTAGSGSVTVLATLDGVVEPDEPLTATIASITDPQDNYENYELGTPAGTGLSATTVIEDASALKVALTGAATVVEGESAEYTVTFEDAAGNPVALLAGQSVTVTLGTAAGLVLAATEGVDYVSVDGDTVTITGTADGVSSTTFTVETTDDYLADTGEQYIVEISDPTGTGLGSTVGIATGKGTVTTTIADQTGTG